MATTNQTPAAITSRFLQICMEAIGNGEVKSKTEFCQRVGEYPQNLAAMKQGRRTPTLEQLVKACLEFGYSANWLLLGVGPKQLEMPKDGDLEGKVDAIQKQLAELTRLMQAEMHG